MFTLNMRMVRSKDSYSLKYGDGRKLLRRSTAPDREIRSSFTKAGPSIVESEPPDNELAILVMGVTGSGKSAFISRLTGDEVGIGHTLKSCTTEVVAYTIPDPGGSKVVHLIDTPGFDDTQTSDVELLRRLASALEAMYTNKNVRFAGIIYMHRITDQRVTGSALKSLRIFEKLCGEENFPYVTLVTTMWNLLETESERRTGEERERTLVTKDEFFGRMIVRGARIMRDSGHSTSAGDIIAPIVQQKRRIVTALQRDMAVKGKTLEDTSVGAFLHENLEQARRRYEVEREELEDALEEARHDQDNDLLTTISDHCRDLDQRRAQTMADEKNLTSTREDFTRLRSEWSRAVLEETEEKERELEESQKQISSLERKLQLQEEYIREQESYQRQDQYTLQEYEATKQLLQEQILKQRSEHEARLRKKAKVTGFLRSMRILNPCIPRSQVSNGSPSRENHNYTDSCRTHDSISEESYYRQTSMHSAPSHFREVEHSYNQQSTLVADYQPPRRAQTTTSLGRDLGTPVTRGPARRYPPQQTLYGYFTK